VQSQLLICYLTKFTQVHVAPALHFELQHEDNVEDR